MELGSPKPTQIPALPPGAPLEETAVQTAASVANDPVTPEVPEPSLAGPGWGLNVDGAYPKWGARAIFNSYGLKDKKNPHPLDIVGNRQSMVGGDHPACREALGKWLDRVGIPLMDQAIAAHPHQEIFEVKSHLYTLHAKNQGQGGYVYLGAATLGEATPDEVALAKWSGEGKVPALGERVNVRMNRFGPGTVVGHFVEAGYAGIKVLLDAIPAKKEANGYDWAAHLAKNKSIEVIHAFGIEVANIEVTADLSS